MTTVLPVPKRSPARRWTGRIAGSPVALALGLGLAAALLYLSRRSISLDDFDSVSFALALRDFNLFVQQPQPPGFPVYVALGRALLRLHADPRWALVTLSALSGGAAVSATFGLGYLLSGGRRAAGLAAALLLGLMPLFWLSSEKALSDVPALAALLVAILLLILARERVTAGWAALAGLAAGLSLGFRPQNVLALLPFALALALVLARRGCWRGLAALSASALAGVVVWLAPVVEISLGPSLYLQLLRIQGRHVWQTDSLFAAGPLSLGTVHARLSDVLDLLVQQTTGLTLPARFPGPLQVALALALALLGGLGLLLYVERRRTLVWLTAAWLTLGAAQYALLESLGSPRLMLLFVPALVLLAGLALARLPWRALAPLLAVASLQLVVAGWGPATILATQQSPPMQAAGYLRERYSPSDTLLLAAGSFRHLHYALPDYSIYYGYYLDRDKLAADLASGRFRQVVVVDPDSFSAVDDLLGAGGRYLPTGDRVFSRDPRAHLAHSRVEALILTRADLVSPDTFAPPPGGTFRLGQPGDAPYLGAGWFGRESVAGQPARWAGAQATLRVHLAPSANGYTLRFAALGWLPGQSLTLVVNSQRLPPLPLAPGWTTYTVPLPAGLLTASLIEIQLQHSTSASPAERSGGDDQRRLAAAYAWFAFQPR